MVLIVGTTQSINIYLYFYNNIALLCSDIENEEIHLVKEGVIPVDKLSEQIPKDNARYHLYSFAHKYEGTTIQSVGTAVWLMFSS